MSLFLSPLFVLPGGPGWFQKWHVICPWGSVYIRKYGGILHWGWHTRTIETETRRKWIFMKNVFPSKKDWIVISKNSCLYFQFLNWLNIYLQGCLWSREVSGFLVTILKTSTGNNVIYKCCKEHVSKCTKYLLQ